MNAWLYLAIAIGLEACGTLFLKLSDGFQKWHWGVLSILCFVVCLWALTPALKVLPVGVVYAIWAGVGILLASILGLFVFGERLGAWQVVFIAMILGGAVGLRLTTTS